MEPPVSFNAEEVRSKKTDVLKAMRRFTAADMRVTVPSAGNIAVAG